MTGDWTGCSQTDPVERVASAVTAGSMRSVVFEFLEPLSYLFRCHGFSPVASLPAAPAGDDV